MCQPCPGAFPPPPLSCKGPLWAGSPGVDGTNVTVWGLAAHLKESPGWLAPRTGPIRKLFLLSPIVITFSIGVWRVLLGASS